MMKFSYEPTTLGDFQAVVEKDPATNRSKVKHMLLGDKPHEPTGRFWQSLYSMYGFNNAFFSYFDHGEVFNRIAECSATDRIRVCIEHTKDEEGVEKSSLLACSNPGKPVVRYDDLMDILEKHGDIKVTKPNDPTVDTHWPRNADGNMSYSSGLVRSVHVPTNNADWEIGGDTFSNRYVLDTPIDGYGKPSIYLAALRHICSNSAIAQSKIFRSHLAMGRGEDDFSYPIIRALEGFNNEDGFLALRQRFQMAQHSWASINETQRLYKTLARIHANGLVKLNQKQLVKDAGEDGAKEYEQSPIMNKFNTMLGTDMMRVYGLANLDALSTKRQRTLPSPVKVYDLINFASEVATHQSEVGGSIALHYYLGELIGGGEEYDLEGTCEKFSSWKDFLVLDKDAIEAKASLDALN